MHNWLGQFQEEENVILPSTTSDKGVEWGVDQDGDDDHDHANNTNVNDDDHDMTMWMIIDMIVETVREDRQESDQTLRSNYGN